MRTWSGQEAPLRDGEGVVSLLDLAVHLGREPRYGGFGAVTWTVLHHSWLVSTIWLRAGFPAEYVQYALLHDAHEAYLGDTVSPVKALLREISGSDPLGVLERRVDSRIAARLGVPWPPPEPVKRLVKLCDLAALVVEGRLFGAPGTDCVPSIPEDMFAEVEDLIERSFPDFAETVAQRSAYAASR